LRVVVLIDLVEKLLGNFGCGVCRLSIRVNFFGFIIWISVTCASETEIEEI